MLAGRAGAISDMPLFKVSKNKSRAERIELVVGQLRRLKAANPRTVKTLGSTIAALFQKQLSDKEVSVLIDELAAKGHLTVSGTRVNYVKGDG